MKAYARLAIPWVLVGISLALIGSLLALVRYDPWTLWPLQGLAVGVLAAAVGWCLDEPAAAVVDATPRGLAWRTGVRSIAIAALLAEWTAVVAWAGAALFDNAAAVWLQGVAATALAAAWVTWRRSLGEATPGGRWALAAIPIAGVWALVRPAQRILPIFPYGPGGPSGGWALSEAGWAVAGTLAIAAVAATLLRRT